MSLPKRRLCVATAIVVCASVIGLSRGAVAQEISADQRRQAGAAYDSAVAAEAARDFASAANFFETADRLAPSPQALNNALRAHRTFNTPAHNARAATLALRMLSRYGSDTRVTTYANRQVQELGPSLSRVAVRCTGCEIEIDGAMISDMDFYIEPGSHTIIGHWSQNRTRRHQFMGVGGTTENVTLETPPEPPPVVTPPAVGGAGNTGNASGNDEHGGSSAGGSGTQGTRSGGGLSPAVFITGLVITAGLGGVLIWSAVDMYGGVAAYEANPTIEGLQAGQARELRTTIFSIATGAAGAFTIGTLIFPRWGGGNRVEASPAVQTSQGAVPGLTLRGRF